MTRSSISAQLLRSLLAQTKGKMMHKLNKKPSQQWLVRNPSMWNDHQAGYSTDEIAERYNLSLGTVLSIFRAYKRCPANPRKWHQEHRYINHFSSRAQPPNSRVRAYLQNNPDQYVFFTYKSKTHCIPADTLVAIESIRDEGWEITNLINVVNGGKT